MTAKRPSKKRKISLHYETRKLLRVKVFFAIAALRDEVCSSLQLLLLIGLMWQWSMISLTLL